MVLTEEIARDLRAGAIFDVEGERIGVRKVQRVWFNFGSGCYVAKAGAMFLWTDEINKPWRCAKVSTVTNDERDRG